MNKNLKKIEIKAIIPKDLPSYSVSGFFGGLSQADGIIKMFEDDLFPVINEQGLLELSQIHRTFLVNLRISPTTWKRMAYWMIKHVKEYETKFGEIKVKQLKGSKIDVGYEFM